MEEEKIYFQAINSNFEPPHNRIFTLYKKYKSYKKIFQKLEKEFKIRKNWEKEYEKLKDLGGEIILRQEKEFPETLKRIKPPLLGIFILGKINLNSPLKIAIVGTRKATEIGKKISFKFSSELANLGVLIISGLAYGIDEYAHRGALENKKPNCAVIGCGLDVILKDPRKNLVKKILEAEGFIISEYSLSSPPLAYHFPLRNRIVAGLSDGILIIEAPIDSGALITGKYALNYGKEIFVVPGSIYEKNYLGSLRLIQQGAHLVIEVDDILRAFDFKAPQKIKNLNLTPREKKIYELITTKPTTFEEIQKISDLPINELLTIISFLEIKGLIVSKGGKLIAL